MKKLFLLLSYLILFSACSSDDSSINGSQTSENKLKKVTTNEEVTTFFYSNNQISYTITNEISTGDEYKEEYIYENGVISKIKRYTNNVYQSNSDTFYAYSNGKISTSSSNEDDILFSHQYTYNSLNQMTKDAQYDDGVYNSEETFTYFSDGNIQSHSHSAFSGIYNFTYDNKINPLYYAYPEYYSKILAISKNNETTDGTFTFEYVYNSDNLPIQKTTKLSGTVFSVENFEYY